MVKKCLSNNRGVNWVLSFLIPFFPHTDYLKRYWWHRLALVLTVSFSLIGVLIIGAHVVNVATTFKKSQKAEEIAEQIGDNFRVRYKGSDTTTAASLGRVVKEGYPKLKRYDEDLLGKAALIRYPELGEFIYYWDRSYDWDGSLYTSAAEIILLGGFCFYLVPSGIYRIFIYIVLGTSWRSKLPK